MTSAHNKPRALPQPEPLSKIGKLAAEIVRLDYVCDLIEETKADADPCPTYDDAMTMTKEDVDAEMAALPKPLHLPDGRIGYAFFESVREEVVDRRDILEAALSIEEPQSIEDVGTLVMIYRSAVDGLLDHDMSAPEHRYRAEKQERRVRRLGRALCRGVSKFASSSLTECNRYWSPRWDGRPWEEDLSLAEAELAKLKAEEVARG